MTTSTTTRRARRLTVLGTVAIAGSALLAASAIGAPDPGKNPTGHRAVARAYTKAGGATVHYAVNRPACARPSRPDGIRCYALKRVDVPKGTPGSYRYIRPADVPRGLGGGYTPAD